MIHLTTNNKMNKIKYILEFESISKRDFAQRILKLNRIQSKAKEIIEK